MNRNDPSLPTALFAGFSTMKGNPVVFFYGKLTKSGIPGWFLNKIGYLFFRDGARLRTSAKRLQNAFWRLNPLRLVCAQHPKTFFRCSTPQNNANDGAQKCSPRTTRFCSGTHRVYPALCFDFINHQILFILHPILFIPHNGRSFTQLASCRL